MHHQLIQALVDSTNEAADQVLLDGLRLGSEAEQAFCLEALIRRGTVSGLSGVVGQWMNLPPAIQATVVRNIRVFHPALRQCARGADPAAALAAMRLIALGRQGKLTYLLSEGLHRVEEDVSQAAAQALVDLAGWVVSETRRLQRGEIPATALSPRHPDDAPTERDAVYRRLMEERPEIEQAVARAMDVHRGRHGAELLRAALLLADWPGSRTLSILQTAKHNGQVSMIRRLQQPPDAGSTEAFLLAATHGGLRGHFGVIFSHISEPSVLDTLLCKTHWLKDQQLQLCMRQVSRGIWWEAASLEKDLTRRDDADAARIAEWIAVSGIHDVVQDERLEQIRAHLAHDYSGRLRVLRIAMQRPRGCSMNLLRKLLSDQDEQLARMAAREFVRRKPPEYENLLIQLMASAPPTVRRVIGRCVGAVGFEYFWQRFDQLDKSTRAAAGRTMLKALPDGLQRLERRMRGGTIEERLKAIRIVQDLGLAETVKGTLLGLCADRNPKLRSRAVALLAAINSLPPDPVLDRVLNDEDPRVRANAIEVLEAKHRVDFVPLLTQRARSPNNRERANAIKALHRMRVGTASTQLANMLQDQRPEHRISALWALKQIGWWQLVSDVANLAKNDPNPRVRRYALAVLRNVAQSLESQSDKAAG